MTGLRGREDVHPEIEKCEFEAAAEGDESPTWSVDIPEDANVSVSIEVRVSGTLHDSETWGGGNIPGRYELTLKEADFDD